MTPEPTPSDALEAAMRFVEWRAHDAEWIRRSQALLPFLNEGESVDVGAMRILADRLSQASRLAAALEHIDSAKADSPEALVAKMKTLAYRALASGRKGGA